MSIINIFELKIMKTKILEKKKQIFKAAELILSQKGLANTSIAEIANKAGITDSLIYNYFKSKEDLLFSVAARRAQYFNESLREQLQGIFDPMSKLSKMVWFHLYFNNTHPEHLRLLLFECRSNRNFYKHKAYTYVRNYARIMRGIFKDGVKQKVFREDVNLYLARDIIFGLLDWENLDYITSSESKELVPDFQDILNLIIPMLVSKAIESDEQLDKSTHILLAAESVFAEKGYSKEPRASARGIKNRILVVEEFFPHVYGTLYSSLSSHLSLCLQRF